MNHFSGILTKQNTVVFAGGEFECDVTQLYPGSYLDERGHLMDQNGSPIAIQDIPVTVDIPVEYIDMSDDENEGGTVGEIVSLIYVGDHYRYTVRTESGDDFVIRDEDLWNEFDHVSVIIPANQIKLTLQEES